MKTLRHLLLALPVLAAFTAQAAEPAVPAKVLKACKEDIKTLCEGVQRGEGRIAACLKEKADKVSEGCKAAVKDAAAARKGAKAALSGG